jgi:uncharacterized surface protein with fasciclin (FAS1) repeats
MNNKTIWVILGALVLLVVGAFLWQNSASLGLGGQMWGTTSTTPTSATTTSTVTISSTSRSSEDVATIAASLTGASTFASLFASTGVKATITGKGPYTIFVPTDGAISLLAPGTIQNLSAAAKKRLVQYHVIKGTAVDPTAVKTGFMTAVSGDVLNFTVNSTDQSARINNALVVKAYKGSNGVVYLISQVLFPPTPHVSNQGS